MKINEVITKKERVDEILPVLAPLAPLAMTAARAALPHVVRYGKKAYDYGKKFLPVMKKTKGALHGTGAKIHAATEIGKKVIKKTPPDSSTPDVLAKADVGYGTGQVDPSLANAAKKRHPIASPKLPIASPKPQGKLSPEAGAAIAQAQQAQRKRQRP
jgi:hypothetical protein